MNVNSSEKSTTKQKDYFSFIKEVYIHYINYLNEYKTILFDYTQKLKELQEKSNFKYDKNTDEMNYQKIHPNFIIDITSYMSRLMLKMLNNLAILLNEIDLSIETLNKIFKDNIICIDKSQREYLDFKSNLLKNCENFEKLGIVFTHSMQNTEDFIYKFSTIKFDLKMN